MEHKNMSNEYNTQNKTKQKQFNKYEQCKKYIPYILYDKMYSNLFLYFMPQPLVNITHTHTHNET